MILRASLVFAVVAVAGCQRPVPMPDDDERGAPLQECLLDADCATGLCSGGVCDPYAVAPDTGCASKSECGDGLVCRAAACVAPVDAPCASGDECPGDAVCNGFTATCVWSDGSAVFPGDDGPVGPPVDEPPVDEPPVDEPPVDEQPPVDEEPIDEEPIDPPPSTGASLDLSGYTLENREGTSTAVTEMPGEVLFAGEVFVIARDVELLDFEAFWGPLPAGTVFMNAGVATGGVPIVNGGERFALVDPSGAIVDGETMAGAVGKSARRISTGDASLLGSWEETSEFDATPGTVELPLSGVGLVISEWADASGTGNFPYEFIELYYAP